MNGILRDLAYGVRLIGKSPGFSAAVVLILAVGVGSATAIFSIVNSVMLRPLPYPDSDRIVRIYELNKAGRPIAVSLPNYLDWVEQSKTFEAITATTAAGGAVATVVTSQGSRRASVEWFHGDLLGVLRTNVGYGRGFAADDVSGVNPVVVASHAFATSTWGSATEAVGQAVNVSGGGATVIGVIQPAADERIDLGAGGVVGTRPVHPHSSQLGGKGSPPPGRVAGRRAARDGPDRRSPFRCAR